MIIEMIDAKLLLIMAYMKPRSIASNLFSNHPKHHKNIVFFLLGMQLYC